MEHGTGAANDLGQGCRVRAGAQGAFEAEDVDSCCTPAEPRRRSEEQLSGGEPFDNLHSSAAKGTVPA
jgi:hypothetical protein